MKNNNIDLNRFVNCLTNEKVKETLVNNFIARRKELKISQKELANRSGVSYASIRRFENTGEISLDRLISLSRVINCIYDFNSLFIKPNLTDLKDRYDKEYK